VVAEAVILRILQERIFVVQPGPCAGAEANRSPRHEGAEQATEEVCAWCLERMRIRISSPLNTTFQKYSTRGLLQILSELKISPTFLFQLLYAWAPVMIFLRRKQKNRSMRLCNERNNI
jgi:hypothetical protein